MRAQAQRAKAQQAEAQGAVTVRVTVNGQAAVLSPATRRRGMRTWRDIKGWLWILFWCGGGMGLVSSVLHPSHPAASSIHVSGNNSTLTYAVSGKDVEVSGHGDDLTLKGGCRTLKISGEGNHVIVDGTVSRVITDGDNNVVYYLEGPAPEISGGGNRNRVEPPRQIAPPRP